MIGTTIDGRYAIESRLGEGGMGMVYKARHVLIDKPVAIKILRKEAAQDAASVQRFIQEAKSASKINHSNIVDITDFGVLPDGHAYFVMEFLQGQTLAQAILEGPMDPPRVCVIGAQMARGLHAAHQKGIVHRDLKPENVFLLEREGQADVVKIVDFGIAKISGGQRLTQVGMVLGTPEYMSPEQATGAETDHRVDQYALGCIMYEMLTGAVPFLGERPAQTLTKHVFEALVPPGQRKPELNIPPSLEAIVVRTLGKKPGERYPSMRELELALTQEELELRGQRSGPNNGGLADTMDHSLPPMQMAPGYPQQPGYPPPQPYSQPQMPSYVPVYGQPGQPGQPGSMAMALPHSMVSSGVVVAPFNSGQGPAFSGPMGNGWQAQRSPRPTKESAVINRHRRLRTVGVAVAAAALAASGALSAYYLATRNQGGGRVDPPPVDAARNPPLDPTHNPPPDKLPVAPVVPPPPVKAEVKPVKPPENIQLVIDTVPPGAKILLNGRAWAQDTPAIVTQPYGVTVRLELRKKGYLPLIKTHRFDEANSKLQEVLAPSGRRKVRGPTPKVDKPPTRTPAPEPSRYRPTPDKSEIRDPFGPSKPGKGGK